MASNCSFAAVDGVMSTLELVIYVPVFVAGLLLNAAALLAFCVFLRKWTESTIYMTSLALMDVLLLLPLPFKMHAAKNEWPAGLRPLCSFLESFYFVGIYGSIYTIACIAVDRWGAICHPFRARQLRSPRAALGACAAVWLLALAAIVPSMHGFREGGERRFHCFHRLSPRGWRPLVIVCLQVFGFLLPALVVVGCSARTVCALRRSGRRSARSRACVKVIYSSLSAFLLPFTPSHVAIFLQFLVHQQVIQDCAHQARISLFLQVALCLSNITCCLDAFCYYFIAHEVRSSKRVFRTSSHRRATCSSSELSHGGTPDGGRGAGAAAAAAAAPTAPAAR